VTSEDAARRTLYGAKAASGFLRTAPGASSVDSRLPAVGRRYTMTAMMENMGEPKKTAVLPKK